MAKPHTPPPTGQPHGTADQSPVETGQAPGGSETSADGAGRIAALSSQLKGLAANVARAAQPEAGAPTEELTDAQPAAETQASPGTETGGEDDWGIASSRPGLSRETKLGFAFVFVLMVVFGFVVYKKWERNRAERGELLAGAQAPAPAEQTSAEDQTSQTSTASNPISENPFPPAQNEFPEPAVSPASWNQQPFESQTQVTSTPSASTSEATSTSINDFPPAPGHDFGPPVENASSSQPFPSEAEFPAAAPAQHSPPAQPVSQPEDFAATPFPEPEPAKAPAPPNIEPTVEVANQNEFPAQPAEPAGESAFSPFGQEATPAQPMPAQPMPADVAQTAPEGDNEQFSAQSQSLPQETVQTPPASASASAGNPFGEFPQGQAEPAPAEMPTAQSAPESAGDPFAVNPPAQPESAETVPSEPLNPAPVAEYGDPPISQSAPEAQAAPVQVAQPEPAPAGTSVEMPAADDPRFGDFRPAPASNQYQSGVPNELPSEMLTQLTAAEITGGSAGRMQPADRPNVYRVRPGDNYWSISKTQYGTVRYFMALARYNQERIPDPKKMRPGMKILIPSRDILEARNPDLFPKFASNAGVTNVGHEAGRNAGFYLDANGTPMYRVGPDDTLGGIAHKHLGRFSRWVEIYQMNRHRLKDPNALTLGDVLVLPADASRVSMVRPAAGSR